MLGAVIGDIVGSPYEFLNAYSRKCIKPFEQTWRGKCRFTDDSVLSMAVANALLHSSRTESDDVLGDKIAGKLQEYYRKYPLKRLPPINSCYGVGFAKWAERGDIHKKGKSWSNGGAMRIVPVGWLYSTLEETLRIAKIATERTHNSQEAIAGAQMIAAAVFLARQNQGKEKIRQYAEQTFGYTILKGESGLNKLRDANKKYRQKKIAQFKFGKLVKSDTKSSVEEALFAFLNTSNFEECIRMAIAIGGDSDTIACMAGGIAEAFYGEVPMDWKYRAGGVLASCNCREEDLDMVMNFKRYIQKK